MNLDKFWVYRFIRTDLPPNQDLVQLGHASWHLGVEFALSLPTGEIVEGIPYNITVGAASFPELQEVGNKLTAAGVRWSYFTDTDVDPNPSAIVTFPVDKKTRKKSFLNHGLKLYSPRVPLTTESRASVPSGEPNAEVAQCLEHSVFNGEVEGSNPSLCSNF